MRNLSFSHTSPQMLARTKTVTRRLAWRALRPGTLLQAVEKARGLAKGEAVRRLGVIRVLNVRREPLAAITAADCAREGFPELDAAAFVRMFCAQFRCEPQQIVTRIEFEHVDAAEGEAAGG